MLDLILAPIENLLAGEIFPSALRHSIFSSVNHKSVATQESDERQPKLACELNRKA